MCTVPIRVNAECNLESLFDSARLAVLSPSYRCVPSRVRALTPTHRHRHTHRLAQTAPQVLQDNELLLLAAEHRVQLEVAADFCAAAHPKWVERAAEAPEDEVSFFSLSIITTNSSESETNTQKERHVFIWSDAMPTLGASSDRVARVYFPLSHSHTNKSPFSLILIRHSGIHGQRAVGAGRAVSPHSVHARADIVHARQQQQQRQRSFSGGRGALSHCAHPRRVDAAAGAAAERSARRVWRANHAAVISAEAPTRDCSASSG